MRVRRRRCNNNHWLTYCLIIHSMVLFWSEELVLGQPNDAKNPSSNTRAVDLISSTDNNANSSSNNSSSMPTKRRRSRLIRLQPAPFNGRLSLSGSSDDAIADGQQPARQSNLAISATSNTKPNQQKQPVSTSSTSSWPPSQSASSVLSPPVTMIMEHLPIVSGNYGLREPKRISTSFHQGSANEMVGENYAATGSSRVAATSPTKDAQRINAPTSSSPPQSAFLDHSVLASDDSMSGSADLANMTASSQTLILRRPGSSNKSAPGQAGDVSKSGRHQNHQSMLADATSPAISVFSSASIAPTTSGQLSELSGANMQNTNDITKSSDTERQTQHHRHHQQPNESPAPAESISMASHNQLPSQSPVNALISTVEREINNLSDNNSNDNNNMFHQPSSINKQPTSSAQTTQSSNPFESQFESIMSLIDDFDSKIITNKSKAQLSCDSGEMIVRLNFTEPFKGIVYPDHNRLSPCRFFGDGHHNYELRLPLRGCGTRQAAPRVFVNDVVVRFHKSLELEEDEVKTLICRYPAPQASPIGHNANFNAGSFDTQPDQFEFVDSAGHRNNNNNHNINPKTNSQTQIDAISENLLVGTPPPIGQVPNSHLMNNDSSSSLEQWQIITNSNSNNNNSLLSPNNNKKNSPLIDPTSASSSTTNNRLINNRLNGSPAVSSGRLPNLNSGPLELLLLISSIMFLVLLVASLSTSYYCVRKKRQRRLMSSRSALAANVAQATGAAGHFIGHAGKGGSTPGTGSGGSAAGGASMPIYGPPMKHMQQHLNNIQHRQLKQHQHNMQLAHGSRGRMVNSFWTPTGNAIETIDELSNSQSNRGRRDHNHWLPQIDGGRRVGRKLSGRETAIEPRLNQWGPNEPQLAGSYMATNEAQSFNGVQTRPISGAVRNGPYAFSTSNEARAPSQTVGRTVNQPSTYALVEPRHLRSSEQAWHTFDSTSPSADTDSQIECDDDGNQADSSQQRNAYKASSTTGNNYEYHQRLANNRYLNQSSRPTSNIPTAKDQQQHQSNPHNNRFFEDLGQQEYVYWNEQQTSNYYKHHQQLHHRVSFAQRNDEQRENSRQKHPIRLTRTVSSADSGASGNSLSVGEQSLLDGAPLTQPSPIILDTFVRERRLQAESIPRLVVKSIEDSYIKKYTEIDTQEYATRDSRQPISLADWRALVAANQVDSDKRTERKSSNVKESQNQETSDKKKSLLLTDDEDDDDSWRDSGEASEQSNLANQLRSLSEVDISFARPATTQTPARSATQSRISAHQTNTIATGDGQSGGASSLMDRKNEPKNPLQFNNEGEKEVRVSDDSDIDERVNQPTTHQHQAPNEQLPARATQSQPETPDLIISPDYRVDDESYNRVRQLQLRTNENPTHSQKQVESPVNSVSYV